jgi:hypothetical protein
VIIIVFTASVCAGQLYKGLGVKAGISSSNQDWNYSGNYNDIEGTNFKGFYFGIFVEGLNYNFFSSILECSYVRKGFYTNFKPSFVSQDGEGYIETDFLNNKFDYISFTYFVKLRYENNIIVPYVLFGPRIDIQMNESIEFDLHSDQFKQTTWGFSLGGGLLYNKIENIELFIEVTGSPDISNLYKSELVEISKYSYEFKIGILF